MLFMFQRRFVLDGVVTIVMAWHNCCMAQKSAPRVSFWYIFPELNREMLAASARIDTVHAWASRYYQWIFNHRGVLYWKHTDPVKVSVRAIDIVLNGR